MKLECRKITVPQYEFVAKLTLDEITGLRKLIGGTNFQERMEEDKLTETESRAVSDVFNSICDIMLTNNINISGLINS